MRIAILSALVLVACAKASHTECYHYASAYEIEYSDGSVEKSEVYVCEGTYHAVSVDGSHSESGSKLTVRLTDPNGQPYFTDFTGQ